MRALHLTFLVVFLALTALPLTARFGKFGSTKPLHGAVVEPERVPLSRESYLDGSFQDAFEKLFNAALGFRAPLIRADNELNLRAFREFTPSPGTAMVLGKHGFIYERNYIDDYNRRNLVPPSELEAQVKRLKLLQDYGKARGLVVLVVISPNKALIYPEYLPPRFVYSERLGLPNNYAVFTRLLKRYEINFVDMQALTAEQKPSSPYTLFTNTGAHWNDPIACRASAEIERFIVDQLQHPSGDLRCEPVDMHSGPRASDRDLLDLANLWSEDWLLQPAPYTRAKLERRTFWKPSVLYIGSSFLWQIMDYMVRFKLDRRDNFFYYYKANVSYPGRRRVAIDRTQIDWEADIFSKHAIVFEINASVVEHVGWGFLEDAERVINATPLRRGE